MSWLKELTPGLWIVLCHTEFPQKSFDLRVFLCSVTQPEMLADFSSVDFHGKN